MRVTHISNYSHGGLDHGASISMLRLHLGLKRTGIDSRVLCMQAPEQSRDIFQLNPSRVEKTLNSMLSKITYQIGLNEVLNRGSRRIKEHIAYSTADVINFHAIYKAFSYLQIPSLTENKPAVFTLTDMWPFTGHCYYSLDCERWKKGCGKCPHPDIFPRIRRDNTRLEWKLKHWAYSRSNFTVVVKSKWAMKQIEESMLSRFPIHLIPNGVDTEVYKPIDPSRCRSLLGIPKNKKVLLFAAQRLSNFAIKGGDLLLQALAYLSKRQKAETILLIMGKEGEAISSIVDIQTIDLGYVSNDRMKAIVYSAADLFLCPTRAEVFGLVMLESIACGTPVVAFNVSGVPDLVRPGTSGYLAEPENAKDLSHGIIQLLEDQSLRSDMGAKCRGIAVKEYPIELWIDRYVALYRQLLGATGRQPQRKLALSCPDSDVT